MFQIGVPGTIKNPPRWNEVYYWCVEQFGYTGFTVTNWHFRFNDEADALHFVLRWGGELQEIH